MNKKIMQKIMAIVGMILLVAGLLIYGVYPAMPGGPIASLIGVVMVLIYIYLNRDEIRNAISVRSAKYGTNTLIFVFAIFLIIVLINVVAERYRAKFDTTTVKANSLSSQSVELLEKLQKPVEIMGFIPPKDTSVRDMFKNLCDLYNYHSKGKVTCQIVVADKNPALARKFLVGSSESQIYGFQSGIELARADFLGEEDFTSSIIKVTRKIKKLVVFTTGHGEGDLKGDKEFDFNKLSYKLESQGYEVREIRLLDQQNIPTRASLLVIVSPKVPFTGTEIQMLRTYLNQGGSLLLLVDPFVNTGFEDLLAQYGIGINDDVVIDTNSNLEKQVFVPVIGHYIQHPITQSPGKKLPQTFFYEARSLRQISNTTDDVKSQAIALTSPGASFGETDTSKYQTDGKVRFNMNIDIAGPLAVVATATKNIELPANVNSSDESNFKESKIVVFGDSDFASNKFIDFFGNNAFILNAINWLAGDLDLISIERPMPKPNIINLTEETRTLIYYICLILLPGIMFITGGYIWWKKRK